VPRSNGLRRDESHRVVSSFLTLPKTGFCISLIILMFAVNVSEKLFNPVDNFFVRLLMHCETADLLIFPSQLTRERNFQTCTARA